MEKFPNPHNQENRHRSRERLYHFQFGDVIIEANPTRSFAPSAQATANKAKTKVVTQVKSGYNFGLIASSDLSPWSLSGLVERLRSLEITQVKAIPHAQALYCYEAILEAQTPPEDVTEDARLLYRLGQFLAREDDPRFGVPQEKMDELNAEFGTQLVCVYDYRVYRRLFLFGKATSSTTSGRKLMESQAAIEAASGNTFLAVADPGQQVSLVQWAKEQGYNVIHGDAPVIIHKGDSTRDDSYQFKTPERVLKQNETAAFLRQITVTPVPEDTEDVEDLI